MRNGLVLAAAAAVVLSAAGAFGKDAAPVPVAALELRMESAAKVTESWPAIAVARRESRLGFEAGGRLGEVLVDVGDAVEAGQTLARLDLRTLEAQLGAARASLREADAQVALAAITAKRQTELKERGHVSVQRLDEAEANRLAAIARRAAAQAQLDLVLARRALAELPAPYKGVITARHLDEGSIAAPGAPVLDIVEAGAVELRAGLPLGRARDLRPGAVIRVQVGDASFDASLRTLTGVVERDTQTVSAVLDAPKGAPVAPGEVVRLKLVAELPGEGFWVPTTALTEGRRGLWSLLALNPDGADAYRLEARLVDLLYAEAERAYVRGAVKSGELILAAGRDRVVAGMRVNAARIDKAGPLASAAPSTGGGRP